jgi:hypothetical protein
METFDFTGKIIAPLASLCSPQGTKNHECKIMLHLDLAVRHRTKPVMMVLGRFKHAETLRDRGSDSHDNSEVGQYSEWQPISRTGQFKQTRCFEMAPTFDPE